MEYISYDVIVMNFYMLNTRIFEFIQKVFFSHSSQKKVIKYSFKVDRSGTVKYLDRLQNVFSHNLSICQSIFVPACI